MSTLEEMVKEHGCGLKFARESWDDDDYVFVVLGVTPKGDFVGYDETGDVFTVTQEDDEEVHEAEDWKLYAG